jgi:putative FmdB family regulatory protein
MPLYDYQCSKCQKVVEVRHGFNDTYGEPCPACGGDLQRVFNPAPIVFKGSGFYITDSRKPSTESSGSSSPSTSSSSSKESAA